MKFNTEEERNCFEVLNGTCWFKSYLLNHMEGKKIIYTVGHSTRTIEDFVLMLNSFQIEVLADIRSFPGSKRYPHFNKENLEASLVENNIEYKHFKELGGRRKANPDSKNIAWRSEGFRGYADYMGTKEFEIAINELQKSALEKNTAYLCAEAV